MPNQASKFTSAELWAMVRTVDRAQAHLEYCDEWNDDLSAATLILAAARKHAAKAAVKAGQ